MRRSLLLKGDMSSAGGVVLDGDETSKHYDTPLTYIGARVHCPACKSEGVIAARGPRWPHSMMGKEQALEGDICVCKCQPFPVMVASQFTSYEEFDEYHLGQMGFNADGTRTLPPASLKDAQVDQPSTLVDHPELICPNMSNEQFYATMSKLRDKSVRLLSERLSELSRWSAPDRIKVERWFGDTSAETRMKLIDGLTAIRSITMTLTDRNYVRYSLAALRETGCQPRRGADAAPPTAAVCKPDGTYQIFIGGKFCAMPEDNHGIDGPFERDGDSKLLTLIHEVSHFPAAMNSEDEWYSTTWSKVKARMHDRFCIENADNIAGYVVNVGD